MTDALNRILIHAVTSSNRGANYEYRSPAEACGSTIFEALLAVANLALPAQYAVWSCPGIDDNPVTAERHRTREDLLSAKQAGAGGDRVLDSDRVLADFGV